MLAMLEPTSQDSGPLEKPYYARKQFKKRDVIASATKRKVSFAKPIKKLTAFFVVGASAMVLSRLPSGGLLNTKRTDDCRYCRGYATADLNWVVSWTEKAQTQLLGHFGWDQKSLEPSGDSLVKMHRVNLASAQRLTPSTAKPYTFPRFPSFTPADKRFSTLPHLPWLLRNAGIRDNIPQTHKQNGSISRSDIRRMDTHYDITGLHVRRLAGSGNDVDTMGCYFSVPF